MNINSAIGQSNEPRKGPQGSDLAKASAGSALDPTKQATIAQTTARAVQEALVKVGAATIQPSAQLSVDSSKLARISGTEKLRDTEKLDTAKLDAIKAKIETAAEIATPEELAYLGTAIDRIGGRATVLEVEEIGDIKMAEMSAHANAVESATLDTIATAADVAIANVTATKTAAEAAITATKSGAETSVTQTKNAALAVMAQTQTSTVATVNAAAQTAIQQTASSRDQAIAATQSAADQAVATAQAAANSVTQQLVLGRKTFFLAQL